MAMMATPVAFQRGEVVSRQGEVPEGLLMLTSGECSVYATPANGVSSHAEAHRCL